MTQMYIYIQKINKIMDMEKTLVVVKREGEGVGGTGSLGLVDESSCIWNGEG